MRQPINLATLKPLGFQRVGHWVLSEKQPKLKLTVSFTNEPAVYLFVVESKIRYVGKSERIRDRLGQYENGLSIGNRDVDTGVCAALEKGDDVSVYIFAIPQRRQVFWRKGLPVDFVSGLEDGLLKSLKAVPKNELWNR